MLNPDTYLTFLSFLARDDQEKGLPGVGWERGSVALFYPQPSSLTSFFIFFSP